MGIINLEQGSPEWLEYRLSKIMATDISVINLSNPFKSELELWEEKLAIRPGPTMNDAMKRGQDLEPIARKLACKEFGINFKPVVYESDQHNWVAASLDGYCQDNNIILEIKCPKEKTHLQTFDQIIPMYYQDQMQWQLIATQASVCYYFSYRPECKERPVAIIEVVSDQDKQESLISKGWQFYQSFCTFSFPTKKYFY